jgi:ParB family chromosome partitioning protein
MTTDAPRRTLTIDDPVAARDVCHVAHLTNDEPGRLRQIPLSVIRRNPNQPRKRFDDTSLAALADSIREGGVLQPIIVQPREGGAYEIVAGERRWRAAHTAGLDTIPALVDQPHDQASALEAALIENMVREDLNPIEEARTIALLLDDLGVSGGELAKRLGRSRTDLVHTVRLLDLPDQALNLIDEGTITKSHGKVLLTEPDHDRRRALARQAAEHGWSVRRLESEIARGTRPRAAHRPSADHQTAAANLQDALATAIGREVQARPHPSGYQILLDQDAADRLEQLLKSNERETPHGTAGHRASHRRSSRLVKVTTPGAAHKRGGAGRRPDHCNTVGRKQRPCEVIRAPADRRRARSSGLRS